MSDSPTVSKVKSRLKGREELQKTIPSYYNAYVFFTITNILGITAIYFAAIQLNAIETWQWFTIPIAFIVANLVEYIAHRGPMHHRQAPVDMLFKRHTLLHHEYFPSDNMGITSSKEAYMVFFPVWAILGVFAIAFTLGYGFYLTLGLNIAALFFIVAVSYYLLYEWLHFLYHIPENTLIGRNPIVKILRKHHQNHHHKPWMTTYNFNVTFPIWDTIMGTCQWATLEFDKEQDTEV